MASAKAADASPAAAPQISARTNLLATMGSTVVAEGLLYPVDTLKCWVQIQSGTERASFAEVTRRGLERGGVLGLYEGVSLATCRLTISTTAAVVVPQVRPRKRGYTHPSSHTRQRELRSVPLLLQALANKLRSSEVPEDVSVALTTPVSTFATNLALVPFETIKTRLQVPPRAAP
jgi:hypothetical protein|eukprot:2897274-Prymnesium_polylepis.2